MVDSPKKLLTVQALRAIAASAVVMYHVLNMLAHNAGYSFSVPIVGASGVDLFFVISGFIMVYTNYDSFCRPKASSSFLRRRMIRIIPLYWLCTTVVVFLLLFAPGLFSTIKFDIQHIVYSYLFLLSKNSNGEIGTVTQTGWTLCYEMYFYVVFAILLSFPRKYFLPTSGLLFLLGSTLNFAVVPLPDWVRVATNPILFEFYLGLLIAFLFLKGVRLKPGFAVFVIVLGIVTIFATRNLNFGSWTRIVCWGLPSAGLLLGTISLEYAGMTTPKLFSALGDSSYSLYLVHPFIVPAFGKLWLALHLKLSPVILIMTAFICALAAGHTLFLLIEKPVTRYLSKKFIR